MKKNRKKLSLRRSTVRRLNDRQVSKAVGAATLCVDGCPGMYETDCCEPQWTNDGCPYPSQSCICTDWLCS